MLQFVVYVDSIGSGSPMDMETDGPPLDDVNMLKKAVVEEATQVSVPHVLTEMCTSFDEYRFNMRPVYISVLMKSYTWS